MEKARFYRFARPLIASIFKVLYRPEVIGKENIPKTGRVILAGNHTNFFDCINVGNSTKRTVHFLAKDELMKGPAKHIFKGLGIIPVDRSSNSSKSSITTAETYLNEERVIGIFPEGTINRTDDLLLPFRLGAVKMAKDTNAPIVPFTITGAYEPFEKGVKIVFHKPITVDKLKEANELLVETVKNGLIDEGYHKGVYKTHEQET